MAAITVWDAQSSPAHAPTEPAGSTITESQALQISESMMIPSGGTRLGLAVVAGADTVVDGAGPSTGTPVAPVVTAGPTTGAPVVTQTAPGVTPDVLVPPATPVARPAGLPLSRKQLQIGGGVLGLVLFIGIVAKCASGGDGAKPADAPAAHGGSGEIEMPASDVAGADKILARADELLAKGDQQGALSLLDKSAAAFPDNGTIPYRAGKLYFAKLWWTEGLKRFRNAVRIDPALKTDPELIKIVLKAFITTPDYNAEIADFLHDDIGPAAEEFLDETARDHPNKSVRARATRELQRYH